MVSESTHSLLAIVGATASGKSKLAQTLADEWRASLISVDSRKIYRGMDIGTAKPSTDVIERYNYGLVNCLDPSEAYSAAEFARDARKLVTERFERNERVVLVGGSGFYLDAFRNGLVALPEIDPTVRQSVLDEAEHAGWRSLHDEMKTIDPEWAKAIDPNDKTRLLRATETYRQTGTPLSVWQQQERVDPSPWRMMVVELVHERSVLNQRIIARTNAMIDAGLADEVKSLLDMGYSKRDPGMATVGYMETIDFLMGEISEKTWRDQIVVHTRQYAKRQRTWFRNRGYVRPENSDSTVVQRVKRGFEEFIVGKN